MRINNFYPELGETSRGIHGLPKVTTWNETEDHGIFRAPIPGQILRRGVDPRGALGEIKRSTSDYDVPIPSTSRREKILNVFSLRFRTWSTTTADRWSRPCRSSPTPIPTLSRTSLPNWDTKSSSQVSVFVFFVSYFERTFSNSINDTINVSSRKIREITRDWRNHCRWYHHQGRYDRL